MVQSNPEDTLMRAALLASTILLIPTLAMAQHVPAIASANATATGPGANASANATATSTPNVEGTVTVPTGMPPTINRLSPSAPLNAKERTSAQMAAVWRNHTDRPARGEDGVLRWTFGASLPSVVCSPLQVCDVALQAGEVVNSIHLGDKVRWMVLPAVAGGGADRTTHLIIKPSDAGLISSILVFTDKRTYSIKLISTQTQWTPLTAFNYPDSAANAWANYGATVEASANTSAASSSSSPADLDMDYTVSGDASWRPVHVYALAGKTYIQFPDAMKYGSAPALVGLANDGGWFTSPSEQMLRYRINGNRYVVDGVLERAKLIAGVGRGQTKVEIRRHS
jgi:type IV secretion system protein VirB9